MDTDKSLVDEDIWKICFTNFVLSIARFIEA